MGIIYEYLNLKLFLQKAMFQIGVKNYLRLETFIFNVSVPWKYLIEDLNDEIVIRIFTRKQNKQSLQLKR